MWSIRSEDPGATTQGWQRLKIVLCAHHVLSFLVIPKAPNPRKYLYNTEGIGQDPMSV